MAAGEVSTVVTVESSRLARSLQDLLDFFDYCQTQDVAVKFVNGAMPDYDPQDDDPTAKLIRRVIGAVNEFQADMASQNVREAFAAKRKRDEHIGRPPFGYEIGPEGHLIRIPEDYERAVMFLEEVREGRPKLPTAKHFGVENAYQEILERAEELYDVPFDDDQWQLERAKIKAGEKELDQLGQEVEV